MTGISEGVSDDFEFLGEILMMPKMGEMGHFWPQSKTLFRFGLLLFSDFFEYESCYAQNGVNKVF